MLAINASPSTASKTHAVAQAAVDLAGGAGRVVDLGQLDAGALLGRSTDVAVSELLASMAEADVLVLVTPVYRATYSGLLKVVFDQLMPDALASTACVLAATGASPAHYLSLDTGLRSLVASLGGWSVPTVTYATSEDFDPSNRPLEPVLATLARAVGEAQSLARSLSLEA